MISPEDLGKAITMSPKELEEFLKSAGFDIKYFNGKPNSKNESSNPFWSANPYREFENILNANNDLPCNTYSDEKVMVYQILIPHGVRKEDLSVSYDDKKFLVSFDTSNRLTSPEMTQNLKGIDEFKLKTTGSRYINLSNLVEPSSMSVSFVDGILNVSFNKKKHSSKMNKVVIN
jgi:HSP20 family molecular chaperone IbpA